ncbi:MAG: hypothetical protein JO308_12915 [Verrucomicrobia bacterium]|nr:hypothetical protein [Verrucomicrobiota bacterium]
MATQPNIGDAWTRLSSKPVRRTVFWITLILFAGGGSILGSFLFLKGGSPQAHSILLIFWFAWIILTGIAFFSALAQFMAREPSLFLSRPTILSQQPITLRWELPSRMQDGAIQISLRGQEECTYTMGTAVQSDSRTFLNLVLANLPENSGQREGVINFQPTLPMHSFRSHHNKIRYWISFQNSRGVVSDYEYETTVEL